MAERGRLLGWGAVSAFWTAAAAATLAVGFFATPLTGRGPGSTVTTAQSAETAAGGLLPGIPARAAWILLAWPLAAALASLALVPAWPRRFLLPAALVCAAAPVLLSALLLRRGVPLGIGALAGCAGAAATAAALTAHHLERRPPRAVPGL